VKDQSSSVIFGGLVVFVDIQRRVWSCSLTEYSAFMVTELTIAFQKTPSNSLGFDVALKNSRKIYFSPESSPAISLSKKSLHILFAFTLSNDLDS